MSKKIFIILFLLIILLCCTLHFVYEHFNIINVESDNTSQLNILYFYDNIVPNGFSKVELSGASWELDENGRPVGWNNGLVIEDISGNQFVWVPCCTDNSALTTYGRYSYSTDNLYLSGNQQLLSDINNLSVGDLFVDNSTANLQIEESVKKYGGFYIGRYETGIENGKLLYKINSNNELNWTGWVNGNLAIKQDLQPWNYITLNKAKELSSSFINNETVESCLLTSYCYDTALKWISSQNDSFWINMYNYGNFNDSYVNTGTYSNSNLNNIYDLVGNLWEWSTEECATDVAVEMNKTAVLKGGYWKTPSYALYSRGSTFPHYAKSSIGFRIILYLK